MSFPFRDANPPIPSAQEHKPYILLPIIHAFKPAACNHPIIDFIEFFHTEIGRPSLTMNLIHIYVMSFLALKELFYREILIGLLSGSFLEMMYL
jgi:hypothetical protein